MEIKELAPKSTITVAKFEGGKKNAEEMITWVNERAGVGTAQLFISELQARADDSAASTVAVLVRTAEGSQIFKEGEYVVLDPQRGVRKVTDETLHDLYSEM